MFFWVLTITFLSVIIKEKYEMDSYFAIAPILLILLAIIFGFRNLDLNQDRFSLVHISIALWVPLGALICYILTISSDLGSVISAGITGAFAAFLPSLNKQSDYLKKIPSAIYCGAFVGMSSATILPSISFVIIAGTLAGLFFLLSNNLFSGVGGKLGTIAFGGVVITSLINWMLI